MSNRYLLTCRCGKRVPVEPKNAGAEVVCECGASLAVPSMLELRKLPREEKGEEKNGTSASVAWGLSHSLMLAGGLILAVAILGAASMQFFRPPELMKQVNTPEKFAKHVENSPLMFTYYIAQRMFKNGLDENPALEELVDRVEERRFTAYNIALGVVGASGLVLLAVGVYLFYYGPTPKKSLT